MREASVSALQFAFEMEFARAYVDSFAQSSDELTRRIGIVEEAMPKMMDYIRREVSTNVYDGINKIRS